MNRLPVATICLLGAVALCISACEDDDPARKKSTTPVQNNEPSTPECAQETFTASEVIVDTSNTIQSGNNASAIIFGISGPLTNFDQLAFETYKINSQSSNNNWVGPMTPGTYKIEEIATGNGDPLDYQTCSLCVTYRTSCSVGQQGVSCQENLFATKGTVVIESIGFTHGEQFSVSMSDLTFVQFDPASGAVQNGGEELCMASASLSAMYDDGKKRVTPFANPEASCVTAGNGNGLGNNIADVTYKKCDGTTVTLHELGCTAANKAIWLATSAEWCMPCKLLDPLYYDLALQNEAIDFYVVLGQRDPTQANMNTEEMMLQVCQSGYGEAGSDWTKVPADYILMDQEWQKTNAAMDDYEAPGIPYGRVLRGSNMEYLWNQNAIRIDDTFPTEESALKAASGLETLVGWDEMIARMNSL